MTRDEILNGLRDVMHELFELDPAAIGPEAHLVDDLDLDSIDAIDMAVKLQDMTGRRVAEDDLKSIRTVADVVDLIERELAAAAAGASPDPG